MSCESTDEVLLSVLKHEGFRSKPYQDSLGVWTIGHGITWISEKESALIVRQRLIEIRKSLIASHDWLNRNSRTSDIILDVTTEMAFQMGVAGVNNFIKMWQALASGDYLGAEKEGLDSKWAKQTPNRAKKLMFIIGNLT